MQTHITPHMNGGAPDDAHAAGPSDTHAERGTGVAVSDDTLALVAEFHRAVGQPIRERPYVTHGPTTVLRLRLLREELRELHHALERGDTVAVLDALTDLQYVLDGAYLALGFGALKHAAFLEVHRANMSKAVALKKRADGKVLKGASYGPPQLASMVTGAERGTPTEAPTPACDTQCKALNPGEWPPC